MNARLVQLIAGVFAVTALISYAAQPQTVTPAAPNAATSAPVFSDQQLDQMLAPIALYPDPLLAQILAAATYPLEIVQADRWLQSPGNAALKGDQLAAALQLQPWDPSVKSLVPMPQILRMMNDHLDWTEKVGDAFLAQQAAVMDSVQRLRREARASGALVSTPEQVVSTEDDIITIEPANPEVAYVPMYSPTLVYAPWPWPEYLPFWFYPWPGFVIGFGIGIPVVHPLWGWCHWRWHEHRLDIDAGRYNAMNIGRPPVSSAIWQHDVVHRHGVPYRDPATSARYLGPAAVSPGASRAIRGYGTGAAPGVVHAPPPAFESFGPGAEVRGQAERGAASRSSPSGGGGRGVIRGGGTGGGGGGGGHR